MTGWQAHLKLDYTRADQRTVAKFEHEGPLRVLQSLYPEGDAVCHNVLVHPPSGLVGGDLLDIQLHLGAGNQLLRHHQMVARQAVHAQQEPAAQLLVE